MPRFYLHLWEGGSCLVDEDGVHLPNPSTAVSTAKRCLGEMLAEDMKCEHDPVNRCIVVTDADGSTVAQVSTSELVERLQSESPACPAEYELA